MPLVRRHLVRRHLALLALLAPVLALGALLAPATRAAAADPLDYTTFVSLEEWGQPVSIAYSRGRFYVVLLNHDGRGGAVDSPLLEISGDGRRITPVPLPHVHGWDQDAERPFSVTVDGDGLLYLGTGRHIFQIDPIAGTGRRYTTFPALDALLPPCPDALRALQACGLTAYPSLTQTEPRGLYSTFGPHGEMYVADDNYNLVWRVPAGGGPARVWARADDARLGFFGLYQIAYDRKANAVRAALGVSTGPASGLIGAGSVLTWPVTRSGAAGAAQVTWTSTPANGTYGIGIGRDGHLLTTGYLDSSMSLIDPQGVTEARIGDPLTRTEAVPLDNPSGLVWVGRYAYVANPSAHLNIAANRAILRVRTGLPAQRPYRPVGLGR
ncbi:hypothetical protein GCM10022215_00480 [Nocardioides fonticola]|uniref:Uncharacterized protein n=1 Tax=Nocardioides fonticola TaxID=450363 RepID=A0ABP7X8T3_9ACTN